MKLLFDENLSRGLCGLLGDLWPQSKQVVQVGLDRAADEAIWTFAASEGFAIVTLDVDFADMAALRGAPPKIIWLRCGNQSTLDVAQLLRAHAALINEFVGNDTAACLEIY